MNDILFRIIQDIEKDPMEDWSLEAASAKAGYSPFYFHRVFKAAAGVTLGQFVRTRQMQAAARQIILDNRVEDVACRFNYSSPEAFSRSFKSYTGKSPSEFREDPVALPETYSIISKGIWSMKSKLIELEEPILVAGVQVRTNPPMDLNISVAWKGLSQRWTAIPHKAVKPRTFGLEEYSAEEKDRSAGITYTACVEVASADSLPEGVVKRTIPAGTYAVFTHKGPTETLDISFRHIYTEGLTNMMVLPNGGFDLEVYDDRFREGNPDSELDIYVPVKPA